MYICENYNFKDIFNFIMYFKFSVIYVMSTEFKNKINIILLLNLYHYIIIFIKSSFLNLL